MALQWLILEYVVVAEAAIAVFLTLPWPKRISSRIAALISKLLQPLASLIPFAVFNLLDLYWKSEHRLNCSAEVCTEEERFHYERSQTKQPLNECLSQKLKSLKLKRDLGKKSKRKW